SRPATITPDVLGWNACWRADADHLLLAPLAAYSSQVQQPLRTKGALGKHPHMRWPAPFNHEQDRASCYGSEGWEFGSLRAPRDGAARSADELVEGVLVGGGVPESHPLAVAQMEDVRLVDRNTPAAPAGRGGHQRDAVLVIGKDRVKVKAE